MNKRILFFVLAAAFLAQMGCEPMEKPTEIRLLTEEYMPLNYTVGGKLTGLSVEIVRDLLDRMRLKGRIEVMDWAPAYEMALRGPKTALFSMVLNADRKERFRWVGPLTSVETRFYSMAASPVRLKDLEDAKRGWRIVTAKDYYTDQWLRSQGFTNIETCPTEDAALQKLMVGTADLMPINNLALDPLLARNGMTADQVRAVLDLSIDLVYIGFSQDVSSEEIDRWQTALDDMKEDGSFQEIHRQWLPSETPPGILQLMTEDYPPITFKKEGEITGLATEMVREILRRNAIPDNIRMTAWGNAYNLTLLNPNVVLFSTERTPQRENLFQWVGPIGKNTLSFYKKRGTGISIRSMDDARRVPAIATTTGWFSEQLLLEAGFTNLISSPVPVTNVRQLMREEVQLSLFTDLTIPEIVQQAGFQLEDLEPVFVIQATNFYIAISLGTPQQEAELWRQTLGKMKEDGTFAAIYRKYVPGADLLDLFDSVL